MISVQNETGGCVTLSHVSNKIQSKKRYSNKIKSVCLSWLQGLPSIKVWNNVSAHSRFARNPGACFMSGVYQCLYFYYKRLTSILFRHRWVQRRKIKMQLERTLHKYSGLFQLSVRWWIMGTESTAAIRTNAEVSPVIQTQFAATLRDLTCASAKLVSMVTVSRALIKMSVHGQGTYVIRQLRVQIFLDHMSARAIADIREMADIVKVSKLY